MRNNRSPRERSRCQRTLRRRFEFLISVGARAYERTRWKYLLRFYFQSATLKINQIYSNDATTTGRAALHNERPFKIASHLRWKMCFARRKKEHKSRDEVNVKVMSTLRARFSFKRQTLLLFFRRSLIQTASKRAREAAASQPDPIRVCKNNISEKKIFLDEIDNIQGRSAVFDDFSGRHQHKQGDLTWQRVLSR